MTQMAAAANSKILRLVLVLKALLALLLVAGLLAQAGILRLSQQMAAVAGNEQSHRFVAGILATQDRTVSRLALDYGWWDEAIINLVLKPAPQWIQTNFGLYLLRDQGIDMVLLFDPAGRLRLSYDHGKQAPVEPHRVQGGLDILLRQARASNPIQPAPASGLLMLDNIPAIAGAQELTPQTSPAPDGHQPGWVLVFLRGLSPDRLTMWAGDYGLGQLKFAPGQGGPAEPASLALSTLDGHAAGHLQWVLSADGGSGLWSGLTMLALTGGLTLALFAIAYALLRRLESRVRRLD